MGSDEVSEIFQYRESLEIFLVRRFSNQFLIMGLPIEEESARQAKKSFRALKSHVEKSPKARELVYLVVNTASPTTRKDDYVPRIM